MPISLRELMKKWWLFIPVYIGISMLHINCGEKPVTYVAGNDWDAAGGNTGQTKYSTLNQINKENVGQLEIAWTFHSGSKAENVQLNPLIVSGVVYITTPANELIALDGTNGQEVWSFDPAREEESFGGINRGLAYWKN